MFSYFIRRLLLIPPTMLLITLLVFAITRMVPGGPIERLLQESAQASEEGGRQSSGGAKDALSESEIEAVEELYSLNKPTVVAYFEWLGVVPKEYAISKKEFGGDAGERIGSAGNPDEVLLMVLKRTGQEVRIEQKDGELVSATFVSDQSEIRDAGWSVRIENEEDRQDRYRKRYGLANEATAPGYKERVVIFRKGFNGLLQGNLGYSRVYGDSVLSMITQRIPIAVYFGLLAAIISYGVSLPLGVMKAIQHRTAFDSVSSILIFVGYSIPGFALGAILLVWLGAQLNLFPLFGLTSTDFADLSFWGKVKDLAHHTVLPLLCYVVSGFAYLTMMMKNSLMDHLAADYVRTAVSRGASNARAVFGHAFRNSIIPIATSLGGLITIFVSGSMLVERVFDIQGFGLLQYQAIVGKDVPVVMGTLTIASFLVLLGNILSDLIVAAIDPRIKFS